MTERCDLIIIGAGACGASIARELSRYNLDIVLLEKENDVSMGSTKANSGIVHGGYAESSDLLKGRLCYKGRMLFSKLQEELNFGFRQTGSLVLSFDEDRSGLEELYQNGLRNGLDDLEIIGRERIREIEPNVNPDAVSALYCRGAGVCSPYEYAIALAENAVSNGVCLKLNREVISIEKKGGLFSVGCRAVRNTGSCADASSSCMSEESYEARWVINCAGIAAADISSLAGESYFTITPRSGEYMILARGTGSVLNTVLFQMPTKMGKGILVTPTYHGNLLIGPDAHDDSAPDLSTHVERLRQIAKEAKRTTDRFDLKQFIRSFTGLRAVSSTHDFIVEETETKGFVNVAGIQSPGITSSPAIALMTADILRAGGCSLEPKKDFNPSRKPIIVKKELLPFSSVAGLIDIPSAPEKIICRCEQVREAEIVDAVHRGIPVTTIDGIKRRTRAGMGFCQGSFCRPRVREILERELGTAVSLDDDVAHSGISRVTKKDIAQILSE